MTADPANAHELKIIAQEVCAVVLSGHLRYPSETGGRQLGDLDLDEHRARFRDRRLVLKIAPVRQLSRERTSAVSVVYLRGARRVPALPDAG